MRPACSEIFFDRGPEHGCGARRVPARLPLRPLLEFYNLVFMEYELRPDQTLVPLPTQNVDTGLGLERGAMCLQGVASNFDTDGFRAIMDWVTAESAVASDESEVATKALPGTRRSRPRR